MNFLEQLVDECRKIAKVLYTHSDISKTILMLMAILVKEYSFK